PQLCTPCELFDTQSVPDRDSISPAIGSAATFEIRSVSFLWLAGFVITNACDLVPVPHLGVIRANVNDVTKEQCPTFAFSRHLRARESAAGACPNHPAWWVLCACAVMMVKSPAGSVHHVSLFTTSSMVRFGAHG